MTAPGNVRGTPTAEEFAAHHAAHARDGVSWWVAVYGDDEHRGDPLVYGVMGGDRFAEARPAPHALWSPRDWRLMPVEWPEVSP